MFRFGQRLHVSSVTVRGIHFWLQGTPFDTWSYPFWDLNTFYYSGKSFRSLSFSRILNFKHPSVLLSNYLVNCVDMYHVSLSLWCW